LTRLRVVDTPNVRVVRHGYSVRLQQAPAVTIFAIARALARRRQPECLMVACELIASHTKARAALRHRHLAALLAALDGWGSVDMLGCLVTGPAWRDGRISDQVPGDWAMSEIVWRRRLALVSTIALNARPRGKERGSAAGGGGGGGGRRGRASGVEDFRGADEDIGPLRAGRDAATTRTLRICRLLVRDRELPVVKAMSWSLRVLAKRVPFAVERFVSAQAARLAPLVRREVENQLQHGRKRGAGSERRQ
jgi:3-methyladenine DNA glycosylase AlkD